LNGIQNIGADEVLRKNSNLDLQIYLLISDETHIFKDNYTPSTKEAERQQRISLVLLYNHWV
jgi:hypothetical protein